MSLLREKAFSAIEPGPYFASGDRSRGSTSINTRLAVLFDDPAEIEELEFLSTEEWQLTHRIARSKLFAKSDLLQKFLLHVCELTLRGLEHEITEQRIGTQVFHRPADY